MVKTSGKRVKFIINFQQILNTLFNIAVVIAGELRQGNKNYKIVIISARNNSSNMPSLPQGAFAACKIREQQSKKSNEKEPKPKKTEKIFYLNQSIMEYSPVKYNEKFMNAIWGHYNRYSPHNIKSNDAAFVQTARNILPAAIKQQHIH